MTDKHKGDFFPAPHNLEISSYFHRPQLVSGRALYSMKTLGGPPAIKADGGELVLGEASIPARLVSSYGPVTYFSLASPIPAELMDQRARFKPHPKTAIELKNPSPINSLELFLDETHGWAMLASESLGGSQNPWPAELWPLIDAQSLTPFGISFIWTLAGDASTATADIVSSLDPGETTLMIANSDSVLVELARIAASETTLALDEHTHLKNLEPFTIETKLKAFADERARRQNLLDQDLSIHQKTEAVLAGRVDSWNRLAALERSLKQLREEVVVRRKEWENSEEQLKISEREWVKAEQSGGGIFGVFSRKDYANRRREAQNKLEAAEKAMRGARLEMESLLEQAKRMENSLSEARFQVQSLQPLSDTLEQLEIVRNTTRELISKLAAASAAPPRDREIASLLAQSRLVLARPSWVCGAQPAPAAQLAPAAQADPAALFDNVVIVSPAACNHQNRQALALEAKRAKKRFIVVSDFSALAWTACAPQDCRGAPVWRNFISGRLEGSLGKFSFLGPLPSLLEKDGKPFLQPQPSRHPWLSSLGLATGLAKVSLPAPTGPAFRAVGDDGPLCLSSALASVRLAVDALKCEDADAAKNDAGKTDGGNSRHDKLIYILTPSKGQTLLARAILEDLDLLEAVYVGEPHQFEGWPPAHLAILDTAMGPPHKEHPWANASIGRVAIIQALRLASGALAVVGFDQSIKALRSSSMLFKFYNQITKTITPCFKPPRAKSFTDALDQSSDAVFAVIPAFESSWWSAISNSFMRALGRKVKVTILACV
ncbi:MAG: hypothetical protein LBT62_05695, partial [Deltaproteobacteria bacterium]|nr:hypothetical protein [Deltaproteobacteria bacterium]